MEDQSILFYQKIGGEAIITLTHFLHPQGTENRISELNSHSTQKTININTRRAISKKGTSEACKIIFKIVESPAQ